MLVVATPCPLILAAPIAMVAGISRAARRGIIVKGGGALETLARGKVLLFDKTGTLTAGIPQVADVEVFDDMRRRRAAPPGRLARPGISARAGHAIVRAARERGLDLAFPTDVVEQHGAGIEGTVDGRHVALGKASFVSAGAPLPRTGARRPAPDGARRLLAACSSPSTAS